MPGKKTKKYNSEKWLRQQYYLLRRSPEMIAAEADCSVPTIYRKLKEFGLIK